MSEIDNQEIETPAAAPPEAEAPELSLAEELAQAREENDPEKQVEPEAKEAEEPAETKEPNDSETGSPKEGEPEEQKEPETHAETEAERAQRFYELRQQAKLETTKAVEQKIDEAYKPQTVEELNEAYLTEGYTEFEAAMLAREEHRNQREQILESRVGVAEFNAQLETEAIQVLHECPVYDPSSPEYDEEFANQANALFLETSQEVRDPRTGAVVYRSVMPRQFYKQLADIRNAGMSQAQIKAQRAAEMQMASVVPQSSSKPVSQESEEDRKASSLAAAIDNVR